MIGPLVFTTPLVLLALAALPALWLLLRVTPPQPRRIAFPPLRLLLDLVAREEKPARTPWWLLLLRLAVAACLIVAMAGPVWTVAEKAEPGTGPLVIVIDNGWAAASDWNDRIEAAQDLVRAAARSSRPLGLATTGEPAADIPLADAGSALERLRALRPAPHAPDRMALLPSLRRLLEREGGAELVWIADGIAGGEGETFAKELTSLSKGGPLQILAAPAARPLALAGVENTAAGLSVRVLRAEPNGRDAGTVRASDRRGLPLGEAPFRFEGQATQTRAVLTLPVDLRNDIARLDVASERSAGAVALVDASSRRRRVGLVAGGTIDTAQPLLSPTYYVTKALAPFADLREPKLGPVEAIGALLDERVSMLVLADIGALPPELRQRLQRYVEEGGLLLRFAGPRLAGAASDDLVPVRLRRGGRSLGGSLSWDAPRTLAPFDRESPFHDLVPPADVGVQRQLLAEPDADLPRKTWAALADGTPIITAERRGQGMVVLVHVTADTTWSNLPLSGLFVDMLRRIVALAGAPDPQIRAASADAPQFAAPLRTLDGFGGLGAPPSTARPIPLGGALVAASQDHPPGYYGSSDTPLALNTLAPDAVLRRLDLTGLSVRLETLVKPAPFDLRPWLLALALLGLIMDTLAVLWLTGRLQRLWAKRRAAAAALSALALLAACPPIAGPARAQAPSAVSPGQAGPPAASRPPISPQVKDAALATRFAYVLTGDPGVDETSRAGLSGLSTFIAARTALDPAEPSGVDPARDELSVYPLIYWPIVAGRPFPGDAAVRKLDQFMKGGGTVVFDTRDAATARPGSAPTPETLALRRILAGIAVPDLEPVPRDHVITKAFYLIESFPGRYADGQTWIEALPREEPDAERPARAGDGVSPIIITGNDLAAAWATGRRGEPLYPLSPGGPRQREMAFRGGVNIVMYALTGNYKADQVHVPALLERLGQ